MYFGPKDSWYWVQEDMYTCLKLTKRHYPNLPYILLGLSFGSFTARSFLIIHLDEWTEQCWREPGSHRHNSFPLEFIM